MLVSINKYAVTRRPVQYSALALGTIGDVWSGSSDEDVAQKRPVKVVARRENKVKHQD